MPEPAQDPKIGTILVDRYELLARLSSGGMGVVYRAERLQLGRIVAIKFLHAAFASSTEAIKRFELEARTMSRLDHPNCVSVIDYGVAGAPFIVMDYVTGTTLKELLEDGPVPPARALSIVRQILAGLAHAHEKAIIHRDIKPANIMLTQATGTGDHVKILDFGLAKLIDVEQSASSVIVGTPSYMSPEQAGARKVDARADIYATAVVLFELLTGEKPFFSDQALDLIRMHLEEPPPSLHDRKPDTVFSEELEAAVRRALAKAPGDRFQTPEEFADALEATPEVQAGRLARASSITADRAATMATPSEASATRPARSWLARAWLGGLVALAVVAGGLYGWDRLGRPGLGSRSTPPKVAPPPAVPTVASARQLITRGDREGALRVLHDLRRKYPKNAEVPFLIGNLYFDKGWHAEAIAAYREAIDDDASYRQNGTLNRNAIETLGNEQMRDKARALFLSKIGAAALPHLRNASRTGRTAEIRRQAAQLVKDLARAPAPK